MLKGYAWGRLIVDEVGAVPGTCAHPERPCRGWSSCCPRRAGRIGSSRSLRQTRLTVATGSTPALQRDYNQGVASLNIAGEVIPRVGAPWPDQGTLAARQDIQAFQLAGVSGQAVAATFVYRDELTVAPPREGSLRRVRHGPSIGRPDTGRPTPGTERSTSTGRVRPGISATSTGTGMAVSEIVLEVFGSNRRWYAGLAQRQGEVGAHIPGRVRIRFILGRMTLRAPRRGRGRPRKRLVRRGGRPPDGVLATLRMTRALAACRLPQQSASSTRRDVRVSLAAPARRIVSLVPSATQTLHALRATEALAGRTRLRHAILGGVDPVRWRRHRAQPGGAGSATAGSRDPLCGTARPAHADTPRPTRDPPPRGATGPRPLTSMTRPSCSAP